MCSVNFYMPVQCTSTCQFSVIPHACLGLHIVCAVQNAFRQDFIQRMCVCFCVSASKSRQGQGKQASEHDRRRESNISVRHSVGRLPQSEEKTSDLVKFVHQEFILQVGRSIVGKTEGTLQNARILRYTCTADQGCCAEAEGHGVDGWVACGGIACSSWRQVLGCRSPAILLWWTGEIW